MWKELPDLISVSQEAHLDHIVPLAEYGLNDVTDLLVLVPETNQAKCAGSDEILFLSERWYSSEVICQIAP